MIKIPATQEGLAAITAATAEGISVNVTLIFSLERYRAVMDAYLTGLEQAQGQRHRPVDDPLGRVVLRLPGRHRGRQAARRDRHRRGQGAAQQGRGRQRPARLPRVRGRLQLRPLERAGGRRRQQAAPAVGVDVGQGPQPARHDVRHRARRARHRQHDAGADHPRDGRPRRDRRRPGHQQLRRRPAGPRRPRAARHLLRRRGQGDRGRGRRQVREVLAGAARHRPGRPRRSQASEAGAHRHARQRRTTTCSPRSSPTRSPASSPPRTPPSGVPTPSPRPRSGSAGSTCPDRRGRCSPRSTRCGPQLWSEGIDRVVLCGMGGSSLAPEVISRTLRRAAGDPRLDQPERHPARARRRPGPHRRRGLQQVRRHPRDRQPAARLRRRRSPTPASTPRRASSSSPTRAPTWRSSPPTAATARSSSPTRTSAAATAR